MNQKKTTPKRSRRLGRGLQSIVSEHTDTQSIPNIEHTVINTGPSAAETGRGVLEIPLDSINPGRFQPRSSFDETALASLAESIRAVGVIQPVVVRPANEPGRYELVAGERRWRAARLAELSSIPAIIRESDDRTTAEAALIENLQREDLNPIERAEGLRSLIDRFNMTQQEVAQRVGLDRSSVANLLRLLELEPDIRKMIENGTLGLGHGKALLSRPPGDSRIGLARRAAEGGWSVRRLESESKNARSTAKIRPTVSVEMQDLEKRLETYLGTKVRVHAGRGGNGTLEIRFFGLDHFDDLMSRIGFTESGIL